MNTPKTPNPKKKIIIDASVSKELRVGIIEDAVKRNKFNLTDLHVEDKNHLQYKSNIYLGTITSIEPSLNAVFVHYDNNKRHGFLPVKEIQDMYFTGKPKAKKSNAKPKKPSSKETDSADANTEAKTSVSEAPPSTEADTPAPKAPLSASGALSADANSSKNSKGDAPSMPDTQDADNGNPASSKPADLKAPKDKSSSTPDAQDSNIGNIATDSPKTPDSNPIATPDAQDVIDGNNASVSSKEANLNTPSAPDAQNIKTRPSKKAIESKKTKSNDSSDKGDGPVSIALAIPTASTSSPINFEMADEPDSDAKSAPTGNDRKPRSSQQEVMIDQLEIGQRIVIQVVKEERGSKGAALTTHISLAGSYLVLMPNNPGISGISRRIEGNARDEVRELSKQLTCPDGMGFIIRTAGINQDVPQLQWDLDVLINLWDAINKAIQASEPPVLIHQESDVVVCAVRDYLRSDVSELVVNDKDTFDKIHFYLTQVKPDFADKISHYQEEAPLFCHYGIENQIEQAQQREVRLPSGGSIIIDHTEALVAVDVNSARAKGSDIEDTAFQTNLEAADEVGRQLRLRDLGGLVVIDFIDMSLQKHQRSVESHLKNSLAEDRARIRIGRISAFGLLEMSRQRLRTSLGEVTKMACPRCTGQGLIQSVDSFAISLLRRIREDVLTEQLLQIQLHVPLDVSAQLMNHHRMEIANIETYGKTSVLIIPNANFQTPQHKVKKIRFGEKGTKAAQMESKSYQLIEPMKSQKSDTQAQQDRLNASQSTDEPLVNTSDIPVPTRAAAPTRNSRNNANAAPKQSLVKRLWDNMFTPNKSAASSGTKHTNKADDDDNIGNRKDHTPNRNNKPGQQRRRHPQRRGTNNRNSNNRNGGGNTRTPSSNGTAGQEKTDNRNKNAGGNARTPSSNGTAGQEKTDNRNKPRQNRSNANRNRRTDKPSDADGNTNANTTAT